MFFFNLEHFPHSESIMKSKSGWKHLKFFKPKMLWIIVSVFYVVLNKSCVLVLIVVVAVAVLVVVLVVAAIVDVFVVVIVVVAVLVGDAIRKKNEKGENVFDNESFESNRK